MTYDPSSTDNTNGTKGASGADRANAADRTSGTAPRTSDARADRTSGTGTTGTVRPTGPPATPEVREGREVKPPVRTPEAPTRAPADTATDRTATGRTPTSGKADHAKARFFPQDESDKLNQRLQDALSSFVDGPRRSVEEAAGVLEETAERLSKALAERPRSLRAGWDTSGQGGDGGKDTEDLRLALQSYREVTERLLRV